MERERSHDFLKSRTESDNNKVSEVLHPEQSFAGPIRKRNNIWTRQKIIIMIENNNKTGIHLFSLFSNVISSFRVLNSPRRVKKVSGMCTAFAGITNSIKKLRSANEANVL